ncbi:hypothetical protein H4R26_002431 [Coemansia thaxteri]|uniref:Uncharacterized protein n=1 Tax=Coemansia thaxteri TaxID=2663907 RepID=A0A9W8BGJ9_9FUNG|nr:hypothetical protein H4R26_002431 [Coemansia thaxteri]KAJ2480133.1 hypothetical protein EV174_003811 [Coemansia sp. RSA 2320]
MLGYIEGEGSISLNRLDQGIQHKLQRIPTAAYASDIAVPVYRGGKKEQFYDVVISPSCMYSVAAWITESSGSGPLVEFVNVNYNIRLSVSPAPAIDIPSLPALLAYIRQNPDSSCGPLSRLNGQTIYEHGHGPLIPPVHAMWCAGDTKDNGAVRSSFVAAGAPWSLLVAHVCPDDDYQSARVQHSRLSPVNGEYKVLVRLASARLAPSNHWSTIAAKLLHPAQHNSQAPRMLAAAAANAGITLAEHTTSGTTLPSVQAFSPLLETIAASARAPAQKSPQYLDPNERKFPVVCAELFKGSTIASARQSSSFSSDENGGDHMVELLKEQRNIRSLLEEQNKLMKLHVSQTREMMHMAQHQPSPQTITRRHLRVKGTYTPSVVGHQLPASSSAMSKSLGVRRANSLAELVDGIRSFVVEGYEETEHAVDHAYRRPISFASPLVAEPLQPSASHTSPPLSAAAASTFSSTGISNLVSRINHIVGDSVGSSAPPKPFERPPLPAFSNKPHARDHGQGTKVTPTTQKYLDSLDQPRRLMPPAPSQRRASGSGPC